MPLTYLLPVVLLSLLFLLIFFWAKKKFRGFGSHFSEKKLAQERPLAEEKKESTEKSALLRTYFKGLTYVLANETDKAVAEFVKVARIDTTTAEIYLALGQLFRNTGEMERAIRVHRDILLRPNLPDDIRQQTFFEIGLDYKRAGLLDRACCTFEEILDHNPQDPDARKELSSLYVSLREWEKALALHGTSPTSEKELNLIAHLTTEVAKSAENLGNREKALQFFQQALELDDSCIDAWLHYGDFLNSGGQTADALEAWERAFTLNPDFVSLVTSRFSDIPEGLRGKVESEFFSRYLERYGEKRKFKLAYVAWLIKTEQLDDAASHLEEVMSHKSGDAEVFTLVRNLLQKIHSTSAMDGRLYNSLVCNFFSTQLRFEKAYRCRKCGIQLEEMTWRCPRCSTWDSIAVR